LKGAQDALGAIGITPHMLGMVLVGAVGLLLVAATCLGVWYVATEIEAKRPADYQSGRHP
jgi:hypothetical protein